MKKKWNVGIVGATGAVGKELQKTLIERKFPVGQLKCFSSTDLITEKSLNSIEILFFASTNEVSEKYVPLALKKNILIIDNSSYFRMRKDVPIVVPEINGALLKNKKKKLFANPNCTAAILVMALKPILDAYGIKRVGVSSYQSVSGKGLKAMEEFLEQKPATFNCTPHIDVFHKNGFTGEEIKVMEETRKILALPKLSISATCVRVPVLNSHSESVSVETIRKVDLKKMRKIWAKTGGIQVLDEPKKSIYPLATLASGADDVLVGRLRADPSLTQGRHGIMFWVVGDNLRKGAALNAVQIAETWLKYHG